MLDCDCEAFSLRIAYLMTIVKTRYSCFSMPIDGMFIPCTTGRIIPKHIVRSPGDEQNVTHFLEWRKNCSFCLFFRQFYPVRLTLGALPHRWFSPVTMDVFTRPVTSRLTSHEANPYSSDTVPAKLFDRCVRDNASCRRCRSRRRSQADHQRDRTT
jgi:hypothetical protein